jgi:ribose transport system ATP-binding protein
MVGGDAAPRHETVASDKGEVALTVNGLSSGDAVRDVSFEVRYGEILGLSGLVGSGRTETLRAIFSADKKTNGEVSLGSSGQSLRISNPAEAVTAGIGMIPEDRKGNGLLLSQSLRSNITLGNLWPLSRSGGWIDRRREIETADTYIDRLDIQCDSGEQPAFELSGGNQQKAVLARWLLKDCPILLFDEPTKGIDAGARARIHAMLNDLSRRGKAIVVVSSDLHELMDICDRIAVISAGILVRTFSRGEWTHEDLLEAAFQEYGGAAA